VDRAGLASVLATATLLLAGCGGASLSLIQLRSRASAICTAADRKLQAIPPPGSASNAGRFLSRGIGALAPEVRGLKALQVSGDARGVYTTGVRSVSAEVNALRAAARGLARAESTVSAFNSLQTRLGPLQKQADQAWQALGIPACTTH